MGGVEDICNTVNNLKNEWGEQVAGASKNLGAGPGRGAGGRADPCGPLHCRLSGGLTGRGE